MDTPTRELRIFISSTFRDMQAERDYLVRQVFPGLRKSCRERQVEFTDIDLRWGLTREEAEQGQVVRICLEEVDRCRPYFISLLGERYGWSPLDGDLEHKAELVERFPFLADSLRQGLSVTEMEILHGVLDNPGMTEHCFFYLRDPELTGTLAEAQHARTDFTESQAAARDKLERLKTRIRASGLPVREGYAHLEQLGEWVRQDLLTVLDQRFPLDQTPSPLEAERQAHRAYARDRIAAYIPSPADLAVLDQHLTNEGNAPLVVTGESGLGKSALLAYWVSQLREQQPERFIIEHYAGISGESDPVAVLRRIMAEIKARTGDGEEPPGKPDEVIRDFPLWLARVRESDPLVLVIDGLNQIEAQQMNWLPDFWPAMVKPLFSVIPGETLERLKERQWPVFDLQPLNQDRREQLIRNWLAGYRKALSAEQCHCLARAPQTGNPLFLRTLLEELRIFGYFEHLDQRIATLLGAENPKALFGLVLERLEADFDANTVQAVMTAIWAARRGLTEEELGEITQLNRLTLSSVLLAVDTHLARRGGLLNFFHDYLRQAAQDRYLDTEVSQQASHRQLATYFQQQPDITQRVAEELPWQWQQAGDWEELKNCISAIPMFEVLYERDEYELLGYWLSMGDRFNPGVCYQEALKIWERNCQPEKKALASTLNQLGRFLGEQNHKHSFADNLLRRALNIRKRILGLDHTDTADSFNNLAELLRTQGRYEAAEALQRRDLAICEKVLGPEHTNTAISLNNLGLLLHKKGNYEEAEFLHRRALDIYEKVLGREHPLTANSIHNLAGLLLDKDDSVDVEPMYRCALSIWERVNGPEHPLTANSLNSLGVLMKSKGDYAAAELLYRRAMAIREKVLGPKHPDTAQSINNLAVLLDEIGSYDTAEPLYRRLLAIREETLEPDHPYLLRTRQNFAVLLRNLGKLDEAEPIQRASLAAFIHAYGEDALETASALSAIGALLQIKDKYYEARIYYIKALDIRERELGLSHPSTELVRARLKSIIDDHQLV
jgi:tetratricopeptide (TPR) repeat protein